MQRYFLTPCGERTLWTSQVSCTQPCTPFLLFSGWSHFGNPKFNTNTTSTTYFQLKIKAKISICLKAAHWRFSLPMPFCLWLVNLAFPWNSHCFKSHPLGTLLPFTSNPYLFASTPLLYHFLEFSGRLCPELSPVVFLHQKTIPCAHYKGRPPNCPKPFFSAIEQSLFYVVNRLEQLLFLFHVTLDDFSLLNSSVQFSSLELIFSILHCFLASAGLSDVKIN